MPLEPGNSLGSYQVIAKIGEGGMGEVYQARDAKLERDVALKVLPEAFTSDPERLARFEREARVLASLNHPNIGGIHGLEDSGDVRALVLELVEGPTLADRITQGPVPVDEALPIAKQIAEALEAAHEAGVIHRDLKPANIKVRPDGVVKVLDFGLAKAFQPDDTADPNMSVSPTISLTAAATQIGMVIGTAAYMAPEQASGRPIDRRADIWAFGAVLYEMLTGRRPFAGDDVAKTLARVIDRDPDWAALPVGLSPLLVWCLRGCLEKEPRQRVQHIGDVRLAMASALDTEAFPDAAVTTQRPVWKRPAPLAIAAAVLVAASAFAGWSARSGAPERSRLTRFAAVMPPDLAPARTGVGTPVVAVSGDGRRFVYAGRDQLYVRSLEQQGFTPIRGTGGAVAPFLSPDSDSVAFWSDGQLRKVPVTGGVPVPLLEIDRITAGAWNRDGSLLFNVQGVGIARLSADGGIPETVLETGDDARGLFRPQLLPDGEWVLFTTFPVGEVVIESLVTGERRVLIENAPGSARYLDSGHLVYAQGGRLMGRAFDLKTQTLGAGPVSLVEGVEQVALNGLAQFDVSPGGALVYLPARRTIQRLVWVDRDGQPTPLPHDPAAFQYPRLSPDGQTVAVGIGGANTDVWLYGAYDAASRRLTEGGRNIGAAWTPDGRAVTYASDVDGAVFDIFERQADGSGDVETMLTAPSTLAPMSWTPDGETLIYYEVTATQNRDIRSLGRDGQTTAFLATEYNERALALSPDGRWLAYVSDQAGEDRVYVQAFPEGGSVYPVSTGPATEPAWSHDGTELFFRDGRQMLAVTVEPGDNFSASEPTALFDDRFELDTTRVGVPNYDVAADGRFLMVGSVDPDGLAVSPSQINIVLDWSEELAARLPAP